MKNNGISFLSLLGITFIVLKLTNVIYWSWWLVLLPLYGGLVCFLLFAIIYIYFRLNKGKEQKINVEQKTIKSKFQQRLKDMENQRKNG